MSASVSMIPDGIFGIEFIEEQARSYFFLEADRSTMPVTRTNLTQTSILRKLCSYHETWRNKTHTDHFGFQHFRVLFVTTSTERVDHIIQANKMATDGTGSRIFVVGNTTALSSDKVLGFQWRNGRGEPTRLLD